MVTGRVERGSCKKGDALEVLGFNKTIKTTANGKLIVEFNKNKLLNNKFYSTGLEMFHKVLESTEAGDQLGILLRGIKREEIRRGMSLVKPGTAKLNNRFEAKIYMLTKEEGGREKPITGTHQPQIYSKTWDMSTKIKLPEKKEIVMPGEDTQLELILQKKMVGFVYFFIL